MPMKEEQEPYRISKHAKARYSQIIENNQVHIAQAEKQVADRVNLLIGKPVYG